LPWPPLIRYSRAGSRSTSFFARREIEIEDRGVW
jgi:hypothetical protein